MPVTVCGVGQTAEPVPGYPQFVVMTAAIVEAALIEAGVSGIIAVALAPLIAGVTYQLSTICSTDPPPDPGLTQTDIGNALNIFNPVLAIPAQAKLQQWFLHWYWYKACQCVPGPTPAAPALSSPATVGFGSGAPAGPTATACETCQLLQAQAGAGDTQYQLYTPGTPAPLCDILPVGATLLDAKISETVFAGPANPVITYKYTLLDPTNTTTLATYTITHTAPTTQQEYQIAIPVGVGWIRWDITVPTGSTITYTANHTVYCNGQNPLIVTQPCCPPDQTTSVLLQQILTLEQEIYQGLLAPLRSYSESTVHANLTSGGTVQLGAKTVAVRVNITTDNSNFGSLPGDPTYLLDRGFIVPVTLEAPIRAQTRLVYNPQLYQLPPLTEAIGYYLSTGVTASITELTPGP